MGHELILIRKNSRSKDNVPKKTEANTTENTHRPRYCITIQQVSKKLRHIPKFVRIISMNYVILKDKSIPYYDSTLFFIKGKYGIIFKAFVLTEQTLNF